MPYQNPKLLSKRYPTTDEALDAMKRADAADATARDVRPLMSMLKRAATYPRMKGLIRTRRVAVSSFGWKFISDADHADDAARAKARCGAVIRRIIKHHTQTPLYGAMAVELDEWRITATGTAPTVRHVYDPVEVERLGGDPRDVAVLADAPTVTRRYIQQEEPKFWITDTDDSYEVGGDLRTLLLDIILLSDTKVEWANLNRKLKGIIQALWEQWASQKDKQAAIDAIKTFITSNAAATSKSVDFKFHQVADGATSVSLKDFRQWLEDTLGITILGQANTTELPSGGGSRAALQILNLIRADIYYDDMIRVEDMINSQLLLWDYQLNHDASATQVPWRFAFDLSEEQDVEKNARIIVEAKTAGIPLLKAEVYERLGYTRPDDTTPAEDRFEWPSSTQLLLP